MDQILPGGALHNKFKNKLKLAAQFFNDLKTEEGISVPVIFRPFHEHLGNWFWWGDAHCTSDEYNKLWKFTLEYLRDSLNVHNLIYTISPGDFNKEKEFLSRFPGENYVDIIGYIITGDFKQKKITLRH